MLAPQRFVDWLKTYRKTDSLGFTYQYHPRSDSHSKKLAELIWEDLTINCPKLRSDAAAGRIVHKINYKYQWPGSGKTKTIDLAVGPPSPSGLREVLVSCEIKAAMTEHKKAQPRIFDELQSSYRIVNEGNLQAISAGITFVNIARTFVSPLRQKRTRPPVITTHHQPDVAASMVTHLRGLPLRHGTDETGFDAYGTFVVDCDNRGGARPWTKLPAPQPGDPDHYETFLERICQEYTNRFS